jgi:hypothetical protein
MGVKAGAVSKVRLKVGTESMAGLVGLEAVVVKRVCRTRTAKRLFKNRFNMFTHLGFGTRGKKIE